MTLFLYCHTIELQVICTFFAEKWRSSCFTSSHSIGRENPSSLRKVWKELDQSLSEFALSYSSYFSDIRAELASKRKGWLADCSSLVVDICTQLIVCFYASSFFLENASSISIEVTASTTQSSEPAASSLSTCSVSSDNPAVESNQFAILAADHDLEQQREEFMDDDDGIGIGTGSRSSASCSTSTAAALPPPPPPPAVMQSQAAPNVSTAPSKAKLSAGSFV